MYGNTSCENKTRRVLVALYVILIGSSVAIVLGNPQKIINNNEPITTYCNYSNFQNLSADSIDPIMYKDRNTKCFLFNYKKINDDFEAFMDDYPEFTIETYGYAYSYETFGKCSDTFGNDTYQTERFLESNGQSDQLLANCHSSVYFAYEVGVQVGVFFEKRDNGFLFLNPFIVGYLSSWGQERTLQFGLRVGQVTFHPRAASPQSHVKSEVNEYFDNNV